MFSCRYCDGVVGAFVCSSCQSFYGEDVYGVPVLWLSGYGKSRNH